MTFGYRLNARANLALRRLLRADRPVPDRSDEEFTAEVERNYRWNFAVNMMDGAAFWFGLSFISPATILPLFISKLTDSTLPLAIVSAVALIGWYLPQLFTATYVERLSHKKAISVNLGFFLERLPVWPLPLAALLAVVSPQAALVVFLFAYAGFAIGAGVVATGWQALIARCFPVKKRGRFLGISFFLGAGTGAIGAIFSAQLLDRLPFPNNFAVIFLISAAAITLAWVFLALTLEPLPPATAPRLSQREFFAALPGLIRQDRNFSRFLQARSLMALGNMGVGFLTVAALGRWEVPDSVVALYTTLLLVGQTAGNLIAGIMADRFGHKFSLEMSAAAGVIRFVIAWWAPAPEWYFVVFALLGFRFGSVVVSGILVVFEFSPSDRQPTYVGLASTATGLMNIVAPFIGAAMAGAGYGTLFIVSAAINLLAFAALRWGVHEPRFVRSQS